MNTLRNFKAESMQNTESTAPLGFFLLFVYTVLIFVRPHEISLTMKDTIIVQIVAILCLVFTLMMRRPLKFYPQHFMLLGLVPVVIFSGFLNGSGMICVDQSESLFISCIIPFFLYTSLLTSSSRQKWIMLVCIIAAMFMVYNGYLQRSTFDGNYGYGMGGSVSVAREEMRITYLGFFGDPNDLGMFLVMTMPFAIYFFYRGGVLMKILMLAVIFLLGYGIYATGSRGTLLGAVGVIGAYYLIRSAGVKLIVFVAVAAPALATILSSFGGLSGSESSAQGRLYAWYDGIQMLIGSPIFGVGMNRFAEVHGGLVAHNSYIHVASELGITGYSLWAMTLLINMLIGYQMIKSLNDWKAPSNQQQKVYNEELLLNKVLFYSMVGFMITAFFLSRQVVLTMFVFMGMHTASIMRIIKIRKDLTSLYSKAMLIRSFFASWGVIVMVYITLKVGL